MTAPGTVAASEANQRSWSLQQVAELMCQRLNIPADSAAKLIDETTTAMANALGQHREVMVEDFAKLRLAGRQVAGQPFVVPSQEMVDAVAPLANLREADSDKGVREYFKILKERLVTNDKLKIDRFLALKVSEEKSRIVDDPLSGQKVIAPAKKVISFMAHPKFKQLVGNEDVSFIPSLSLKEGVEAIKSATVILALPQRDMFTETVEFQFNRAGWKLAHCKTADEVLKLLETPASFLVIVDAMMPNYSKLIEKIKVKPETSMVPVIVMLPTGTDPERVKEFNVLGNRRLAQPFDTKILVSLAESELQRAAEEQIIFKQEVHFQFPTTDENIDRANELAAQIFAKSGLDEEGQVALCAAFREGCGNAAQHGNKHRRDKNIDVMYLLDNEKISLVINDEGKGFDWRLYVDDTFGKNAVDKARQRHQQGKLGGLGIMLMLKCTDRVEYNESGNCLTEYKYLPGHGPKRK